jgi:hypothetical protein
LNQFRRFMMGRYGYDQLTRALIGVSLVISLLGSITRFYVLMYVSYLILAYTIFRILSRNINQRTRENYNYVNFMNSIKGKLRALKLQWSGTKTHKYYKCPKCRQTIRVPRGKGRISITCPKCRTEFIKRT